MKERLVGAAVLIAIAVWLIPWVLDGPETPLETNGSSLQLPVAEEPMPMRTQTLRLGDAAEAPTETAAAVAPAPAVPEPAVPEPAAAPPPVETAEPAAEPEEPAVVARAEPAPEQPAPAVANTPPPVATTTPPAATPPPAAAPAAPKPTPAPAVASDWAVQLGVFGDQANARRLAQRAGTFGHKAEVTSYRDGSRTLYRVRVAARTRAEADATASALKAHQIDARVVAAR